MYLIILLVVLVLAAVVAVLYFQSRNRAEMPRGQDDVSNRATRDSDVRHPPPGPGSGPGTA